jgi:hypothetical protein
MVKGFLGKTLVLYASHHWTGFDAAIDQQGGLDACHMLCRRTVQRFLEAKDGKSGRRDAPPKPDMAHLAALEGDAPMPALADDAPALAAAGGPQPGEPGKAIPEGVPVPANLVDWATVNSQRRQVVREHWTAVPLRMLILVRMMVEVIRVSKRVFGKGGCALGHAPARSGGQGAPRRQAASKGLQSPTCSAKP